MDQEYQGRVTQIIARAVCARGKRRFINRHLLTPEYRPEQILGYWVGSHHYTARTFEDKVVISGNYEVTIWYAYDDLQKTDLTKQVLSYDEHIPLKEAEGRLEKDEEVLVTEKMEPVCTAVGLEGENLAVAVEKAFSVEIVGETKMAIVAYAASILEEEDDFESEEEADFDSEGETEFNSEEEPEFNAGEEAVFDSGEEHYR